MESEENKTKTLSRGTLEPLDQIELDDQSEETQENVNEAFGGIMNRVCNKFVSALKSPEKMIEVIRNKNSNTNKEDEGSNNEANMRNDLNKVSNKERSQEINMNITNVTKNNANDKTINKEIEFSMNDENTNYPCGTCKKDVIDDGIECQRCEIWFHFGSCSDVDDLEDFIKE